MRALPLLALSVLMAPLASCDEEPNLFTIDDDIELGQQLRDEIATSPDEYPVLSREKYPEAYGHLERIRDLILQSDDVVYRDQFDWEIRIIDDDETLNAFAAPGGYMYVYTGLIRFLDREDDLAGVIGHEIAHADRRHSTQQLTKQYGLSTLISLILGEDPGLIAEIASGLVGLSFSRSDESESDTLSVRYLCDGPYAANGAAEFFRKLEGGGVPEFLSTHPNPDNRVEEIDALAVELGCSTEPYADAKYAEFIASLPASSGQ
ncbi:MAG: M48 family metalloprotease [Myxococcota bacterium]